jgi:hypothetical protein
MKGLQPELPFTGLELKTIGQNLAIESANESVDKWSDRAYALLLDYIRLHGSGYRFQGEQGRNYCEALKLPEPPSKRAYGGVIGRIAREGLIKRVGYASVLNSKAHSATSTVWEIV